MLSLWINPSFTAARLPSFTGIEFSNKVAINNNNNKVASILVLLSTDNSLWKSLGFLSEEVAMATPCVRSTAVLANAAETDLALPFGCNE